MKTDTQIPVLLIFSLGYAPPGMWSHITTFRGIRNKPSVWGSITTLLVSLCFFAGITFFPHFDLILIV